LGDVMKESAHIAYQYLKAHADKWGIDERVFTKYDLHIHIPEGATPKDGPSAGVTMFSALMSLYTQRKVRGKIAMTGEITLRGKILPVGGVKEKILAAKSAKVKEILLSSENRKDIDEINEKYIKGISFRYFDTLLELVEYAILDTKVEQPLVFKLEEPKKDNKE